MHAFQYAVEKIVSGRKLTKNSKISHAYTVLHV